MNILKRRLLYVMDVLSTSFVHYGCLKDYRTLCMSQKDSFVRCKCLKDVFFTLWMSQRRLLYVMDVSKTIGRYVCLKKTLLYVMNVSKRLFCTLWMSQRRLFYVKDVSKTSFLRYKYLKDVLGTVLISLGIDKNET